MIQESHKKIEDMILSAQDRTDVVNVVTPNIEVGSDIQQVSTNAVFVRRMVIIVACATRKREICQSQEDLWFNQGTSNDPWISVY